MLIVSTRDRDEVPALRWLCDVRFGMLGMEERMERLCGSKTRSYTGLACFWDLVLNSGKLFIRVSAVDVEVEALSGF